MRDQRLMSSVSLRTPDMLRLDAPCYTLSRHQDPCRNTDRDRADGPRFAARSVCAKRTVLGAEAAPFEPWSA